MNDRWTPFIAPVILFALGAALWNWPPSTWRGSPPVSATGSADVITFQGRLLDPAGVPRNGTYSMTFSLFNTPVE
jgi:hypothetical protein